MSLFDYVKNIFLILLLLQFAPLFIKNIYKQWENYTEPKTCVGVVEVRGMLYDSSAYIKQFYSFFKNNEIKAILIKMDCSGSATGTGESIFNELQNLKKEYAKPVIVLVENVCASGGYWIACGADRIIAPNTALIGSIGAYIPYLFQCKDFIEQFKIKYVSLKAGTHKVATDPFVPMSSGDQAELQGVLDSTYETFTTEVAKARNISLQNVAQWADGRLFTGKQAHALGLIDELGSWSAAVAMIKNRALIEGEIEWIPGSTNEGGILSRLFGSGSDDGSFISGTLNSVCCFLENRYMGNRVY